jgi:hypothetical protein
LRKAPLTLKEGTSFNIVAGGATESSWCDYSAEVEIRFESGTGNDAMLPTMRYPRWMINPVPELTSKAGIHLNN